MTRRNKGWSVAFAGLGINLALGVLYAWSIFKGEITDSIKAGGSFDWDLASANDPYALCCLMLSFSMILAGKVQDRFGPRLTAMIGGGLVGVGMIWAASSTDYLSWLLGFGLAPVYIAPLATWLISAWGLDGAMKILGFTFLIVVGGLSLLLVNPPDGYQPEKQAGGNGEALPKSAPQRFILLQSRFWVLWIAYFIAAGAGLMVIGSVAEMAKKSMGEYAFWVVAWMAIGNAGGRIVAGLLSDRIGRKATLAIMLGAQALLMFLCMRLIGADVGGLILILLATGIGFNYGTNLSLFPSFTKDYWGLASFGSNYGYMITAWGLGGFTLSRISQMLQTSTGSYSASFLTAGTLLVVALGVVLCGLRKNA